MKNDDVGRCLQNFAWRNDGECDSYACTIWRSFKVWTFFGPCLRQPYSPLFEVFHMYEHSLKLFLVDRLCALFAIAYKLNKISKNDEILNMFHSLLSHKRGKVCTHIPWISYIFLCPNYFFTTFLDIMLHIY